MHTSTGAYAANALPEEERRDFARHLERCTACAEEVRELQAAAARLGAAAAVTPPPALRERVLAEIATVRQLPPAPSHERVPVRVPVPVPWYRSGLGLAAAVLLAVSLALGVVVVRQQQALSEAAATARAIAAVAADPDRQERTSTATTGGTVTVVSADGQAVFAARDLPRPPQGKAYQLWVIGDRIRSAGVLTMRDGATQAWVPELGTSARAVAVSVEPAEGSDQPTTEPIATVSLA